MKTRSLEGVTDVASRMRRGARNIVGACSLAVALLIAGPALAQAATTTISGTVMGATTNPASPSSMNLIASDARERSTTETPSRLVSALSKPGWKFITGDIDLIAITKANGSALSDVEHVAILKQLATIPGAQHPESATWINDGKFWFKAKANYLTNDGVCCLAQYGPDGIVRAVEFDSRLSDPASWTKLAYRIYWKGGYQAGP